jgi:excisionase family DNA binding protein
MEDKILSELQEIKEQLNELQDKQVPEIMDVKTAARFLQISESKLRRLIADGKVPYRKIDGSMIRLSKKELLLWYGTGKTSFTKRDKSKLEILQ